MKNKTENVVEMSKILTWANVNLDLVLQHSFLNTDAPSFVYRRTFINGVFEERLPAESTRISGICKRLALKKSKLLTHESIDLANFVIRHLENDLTNIAAHRFFSAPTFPLHLKLRGVGSLNVEQQVMLLRSANLESIKDGNTMFDRVKAINDAKESLINNKEIDFSKYDEYVRAAIAHFGIPYSMMSELKNDKSFLVRACLAYNPSTPGFILDELWKDNKTIAVTVADHPNVSAKTLRNIVAEMPYSYASYLAIGNNISWTTEEIESLFNKYSVMSKNEFNWKALRGIASSQSIPVDLVYSFIELSDTILTDCGVVYELLANPEINPLQKELLIGIIGDSLLFDKN